jgi:hypothetical protein
MATLSRLQAEVPKLELWDPFPILCPSDPCNAYHGEVPLFLDYNHISRFGAERVYPGFRRIIGPDVALRPAGRPRDNAP